MSWLVDPAQRVLTVALDGLARREQAVAANLANIDTPGYRSASVDFESELQAAMSAMSGTGGTASAMRPPTLGPSAAVAMRQTGPGHLSGWSTPDDGSTPIPVITQPDGIRTRVDGNGVDLETEMTSLAETQLKYSAISRLLTGKLGMLRDAIGQR